MVQIFLLLAFLFLGKALAESVIDFIYGGDYELGCPLDSLDFIIITPPDCEGHSWLCWQAILSADPEAKVAYYPWDLDAADSVAIELGVGVVAPVQTAEGYAYKITEQRNYLWFVDLSNWSLGDSTHKYFSYPPEIAKYGICATVSDATGNVIGPYGPNVEFADYWGGPGGNRRSYVLARVAGKFSFVRHRAEKLFGFKLSWNETRQICRMLAGPGSADSLGRRESLYGMIDINPIKVDSVLYEFFYSSHIISAAEKTKETVLNFELWQNYPNPFNALTTIIFSMAQPSQVKIVIYNLAGQEVSVLVDEAMAMGEHKIIWDGKSLPSGTYFYRLESNGFVQIKKMELIK